MRGLLLGAGLALSGGRTRLALTAVGVGLGVALLLVAASVPSMLDGRRHRNAARDDAPLGHSAGPLQVADADTSFRGDDIRGRLLKGTGPVPPGVARLPKPGELVVSPALARLLASRDGALLRVGGDRIPGHVIGTIRQAGLQGPSELVFYRGVARMPSGARRIDHFGTGVSSSLPPALVLLAVVALAALLMPVAVFIGAAARFGGEARDRRLAALRLIGADRATTVRIAAGEAALGALAGLVAGAVLFGLSRGAVEHVTLWDISVFSADVRPNPVLALLVVVAVPLTAIAATVLSLRSVVVEPLGVVRQAGRRRRRLAWRLLPPAAGIALLAGAGDGSETRAAAAVVLLLAGVATLLPWVVEAVVGRLGGGAVAWQLAVRRLQLDGGASARMVSGIAVAIAGAIALQTLFSGVQHEYTHNTGADLRRAQVIVEDYGHTLGAKAAQLRSATGVRSAVGITAYDEGKVMTTVGDCAALREVATIGRCADGDRFAAGEVMKGAHSVAAGTDPGGNTRPGLLLTPAAARGARLDGPPRAIVYLRLDPRVPDAVEYVRNAAAADPGLSVFQLGGTTRNAKFAGLRRAVLAGAAVTLLLVGASMLVSLLEQVRDRRRLLAVLAAFGTRRATLGWSVLWQAALPVALGLVLAVGAGVGLGALLLAVVHEPAAFDWGAVAALAGIGAAVVLGVTALSLPPLWRVMRADGLRTE